jgi:predicted nucleic acid-binding protein
VTALSGALDANVVVGLAKGGVFDLLSSLYTSLYIPPSVREEIITQGQGLAGESELAQALGVWITVVAPDLQRVQQFSPTLSLADRELLAVAQAQAVDHDLSGDRQLCLEANRHGMTWLQATDVVVLMRRRGLVMEARLVLDQMRQRGFGIANPVYEQALRAAGEWSVP